MIFPVRGGLFYDPEPGDGGPDHFLGFSIGSGIVYKRMACDVSYQYRFGRDVRSVDMGGSPSTMDIDEHRALFSVIVYL